MTCNLLNENWIPVLWVDGKVSRIGIWEALTQAQHIRQIAASNPMDRFALIRFLLAILYWCQGNPPKKTPLKRFPPDYLQKLLDNKNYFCLLGNGKRFFQDHGAKRCQAVTNLIQEIPSGNNFWHFRHSTDNESGLCLACCAIGLLRLPLYSTSGLSGPGEPNMMAGINGVPPIYALPWGRSLFEILLINWVSHQNIGEPSWVLTDFHNESNEVIPLLKGLTLPSRRVLLHDPTEKPAICINCGYTGGPIVLTCEYQTAGKQESENWNDPHVFYLSKGKKRISMRAKDLTKPNLFKMDRPWVDLYERLAERGNSDTWFVVGFATDKAKNIDVWERLLALPAKQKNSSSISQWNEISKNLEDNLKSIVLGKRKQKGNDAKLAVSFASSIRPQVEHLVSMKADKLICGGEKSLKHATGEYKPMLNVIVESLAPGYTTEALDRRRKLNTAIPDVGKTS